MKPIIKYVGGKRREIDLFKHWIPEEYDRYVEPFVGGGALFFYLNPKKAIINDINKDLINLYKELPKKKEKIIKELKSMKNEEDFYYRIRDMYNGKIKKEYLEASIYMYINRTCYSGMVRYNLKGEFNVPFGRYKNYRPWEYITDEACELLARTTIMNEDFVDIFKILNKKDFVFLDPPYMSTFNHYSEQKNGYVGFSEEQHRELFKCFKETKAKCLMVISEHGIIRELYKDYIREEYDKNYSINVKNRMKGVTETKHLIITNY